MSDKLHESNFEGDFSAEVMILAPQRKFPAGFWQIDTKVPADFWQINTKVPAVFWQE